MFYISPQLQQTPALFPRKNSENREPPYSRRRRGRRRGPCKSQLYNRLHPMCNPLMCNIFPNVQHFFGEFRCCTLGASGVLHVLELIIISDARSGPHNLQNGATTGADLLRTEQERRQINNDRERRRVQIMNQGFDSLREVLMLEVFPGANPKVCFLSFIDTQIVIKDRDLSNVFKTKSSF